MIIKKRIYQPLILTIPEDAAFFSILEPGAPITGKLIMENYINFYCFKDLQSGIVLFRMEDFVHQGTIKGLERCYIPIGIMEKYHGDLDIVLELLAEDYAVIMPVCRSSIDFYGAGAEGTHVLLVYGADTERKCFFCKDFMGYHFVSFEVPFDAMRDSLQNYARLSVAESSGMSVMRVNRETLPDIEYSRVFMEFTRLGQEFYTQETGYGLGAIELYLNEIKQYPRNREFTRSWYVLSNYLRESQKLMGIRYRILKGELEGKQGRDFTVGDRIMDKIQYDTGKLFLKVGKYLMKGITLSEESNRELAALVRECETDFASVVHFFCDAVKYISN